MIKDTPKYVADLAKELRKTQTKAEDLLWKYLRGNRLKGYKFRRQHPIGRCVADFYCPQKRLLIELDGSIHNEFDRIEYDFIRQSELENRNIKAIRFKNEEVLNNIDKILKCILNELALLSNSGEGLG